MQDNKEFLKNRDFQSMGPTEEGIKNNFWMTENQKGFMQKLGEMPEQQLICPASNKHKIAYKKLYAVKLESTAGTNDKVIDCLTKRIFIVLRVKEN